MEQQTVHLLPENFKDRVKVIAGGIGLTILFFGLLILPLGMWG